MSIETMLNLLVISMFLGIASTISFLHYYIGDTNKSFKERYNTLELYLIYHLTVHSRFSVEFIENEDNILKISSTDSLNKVVSSLAEGIEIYQREFRDIEIKDYCFKIEASNLMNEYGQVFELPFKALILLEKESLEKINWDNINKEMLKNILEKNIKILEPSEIL